MDKVAILSELHRVLKDNGRLLAQDFLIRPPSTALDQRMVEAVDNAFIHKLSTAAQYHDYLASAGFAKSWLIDVYDDMDNGEKERRCWDEKTLEKYVSRLPQF